MFKARACFVNGKNIVRMELDGNTYDHAITDNQTEWYCKAPAEAHDDIAIRLAVFYFYKEIYESYRRQLADAYVKVGGNALELPEGKVRCYKLMSGLWRVAFDSNGSTIHYDLTEQESRLMNRLEGNETEFKEARCVCSRSMLPVTRQMPSCGTLDMTTLVCIRVTQVRMMHRTR